MPHDATEHPVPGETLGRWPLPKKCWPAGLIPNTGRKPRDLTVTLVLKRGTTGPFHLVVEPSHGHAPMDVGHVPFWSKGALPRETVTCLERAMGEVVGPDAVAQVVDIGPLMGACSLSQLNLLFTMKAAKILPPIPGWVRKIKNPDLSRYLCGLYLRDTFHRLVKAHPTDSPDVYFKVSPDMERIRKKGRRWDGKSLPGPGGRWVAWFGWWSGETMSFTNDREAERITGLFIKGQRLRRAAELIDPQGFVDRSFFWEVMGALKDEKKATDSEAARVAFLAKFPGRAPGEIVPNTPPLHKVNLLKKTLLERLRARRPLDPDPRRRALSLFFKGRQKVSDEDLDRELEELFDLIHSTTTESKYPLAPDEIIPMRYDLKSRSGDLTVTPLNSRNLIQGEGKILHNCLDYNARSYAVRAALGYSSLFRVESKTGERVAVEVGPDGHILQFYGRRNTEPTMSRTRLRVMEQEGYTPMKRTRGNPNTELLDRALKLGRLFTDATPFSDTVKAKWARGPGRLKTYIERLREAYHEGLSTDVALESWHHPEKKGIPDPAPKATPPVGPVLHPMADFAVGFVAGESLTQTP